MRAAAQALLLAELRRIGADGREEVIHTWAHHLPNYVDSSLSLLGSQSQASSMTSLSDSGSNDSEEHEEEILSGKDEILTKLVRKKMMGFNDICK